MGGAPLGSLMWSGEDDATDGGCRDDPVGTVEAHRDVWDHGLERAECLRMRLPSVSGRPL